MAAKEQVMESRKVKMGTAAIVFNIIGYILVGLVAIICLLPFIMLISGSFLPNRPSALPAMDCSPRSLR